VRFPIGKTIKEQAVSVPPVKEQTDGIFVQQRYIFHDTLPEFIRTEDLRIQGG
jgi:hypothetical protein